MAELTLYHIAPSRSSIVHWMLEEIGEPYDIHLLSMKKGENREPAYLAINPAGKVPALKHKDAVVTEAAAICLYLADLYPRAGLTVPLDDPRRGPFLKWMFFGPSVLEPAMMDRAYKRAEEAPRGAVGYGDLEATLDIVSSSLKPGPYLLGEQFTAADMVVGSTLRWGMMFKLIPERPEFLAYTARIADRPAFKRSEAKDQELAAA
jgi:glutathione S-transferase